MNATPRQLTCYIKKTQANPETWEGFCVEVDIPAIGDTYEEVVGKMHERLGNYIDFIHERQPDDEQMLMFRPMPGGQVWKLRFEERFLQRLPFSQSPDSQNLCQHGEGHPPTVGSHPYRTVFQLPKISRRQPVRGVPRTQFRVRVVRQDLQLLQGDRSRIESGAHGPDKNNRPTHWWGGFIF